LEKQISHNVKTNTDVITQTGPIAVLTVNTQKVSNGGGNVSIIYNTVVGSLVCRLYVTKTQGICNKQWLSMMRNSTRKIYKQKNTHMYYT